MQDKKAGKKAKSNGKWIGRMIPALMGAASGLFILMYLDKSGQLEKGFSSIVLLCAMVLIGMYAAMLIQIILHETGHLIFGLLTGYRFSSFRIASLMWIKVEGRIQFKKLRIAGTGGQCIMIPPDLKDGKMPVMLYNFGGAIVNLITAILCFGLSFLCPVASALWTILMLLTIIGLNFALMNGLPIEMGAVNNDGKNALELSRSEEAIRAFWIGLKANEQISKGIRLKNMPDAWFTVPSDESMKNGIISAVGVLVCNRLMDQKRFDEADQLMKRLLNRENGISGLSRNLMICDRMFVEMITENRQDILNEMRSKDQIKMMKAMKKHPSVLRTEYGYALLAEKDPEKAKNIMSQFGQCAKTYPYPGEIEAERELIALANEVTAKEPAQNIGKAPAY